MKFSVDPKVFEKFPTYVVAVVVAKDIKNNEADPKIIDLLQKAEANLTSKFADIESFKEHKSIAIWRENFTSLGISTKKHKSSIEALGSRIVKGGKLPNINPIIDLTNAVALEHLLPMGAHDIDLLGENFGVRFSREGEVFTPMSMNAPNTSGEQEPELLELLGEGEIVYADDTEVRTRNWVWRQGNNAKITADTKSVFIPIDGFSDVNIEDVVLAQKQLCEHLDEFFDCTFDVGFVDTNSNSVML